MTKFSSFASRYHKLKRDLQDIEEVEYAKLSERHDELLAESVDIEATWFRAHLEQSATLDVSRWNDYTAFTIAVSQRRDAVFESLEVVDKQLNEQRERLKQAFVEQEQWLQVAEEEKKSAEDEQRQREQREADEEAIKRHRKDGT